MDFQTTYVHYKFVVMCFGLANALTSFIEIMNKVFQNYLDSFIIVFIDDILVYSKSEDEHMGHLNRVLQVFKEHELFAKYSNYDF